MTSNVIPLFSRVVIIKNGTVYELKPDQVGIPAGEVYGQEFAARHRLTDAMIYEMADENWPGGKRRIIARPETSR